MSFRESCLTEDQFLCSICLDVFNNPSSTPCGHSFCLACINRHWDGAKVCQCPLCKKTYQKRPDLQINRTLREITEHFRSPWGGGGVRGGGGGGGGGGEVEKDKKSGRGGGGGEGGLPNKLIDELRKRFPHPAETAPVTCGPPGETHHSLTLASSVPNNNPFLPPHDLPDAPPAPAPAPPATFSRSSGRRRFTVGVAEFNQGLPICDVHHKGITLYCRTDNVCVCRDCAAESHQFHNVVTIEEEWAENKAQLTVSEQEIQEMIRKRMIKIEEIKLSVSELELAMERETATSVCMFSALMSSIERSQLELIEVMEMSRSAAEQQANLMVRQLELEVDELRRRGAALADLAKSEDQMHFVKTFPTLSAPPPTKDWSGVSLNTDLGTSTIYRSLVAQVEKFQEELRVVAEKGFSASAPEPSPLRTQPKTRRVQEYALDVTLDSNTAHPRLILSEDMKSVRCGDRHQLLPDNPERFDKVVCVLGKESISSGRHYWEVEVGGKTDWDLGVAKQSINRKGKIEVTPSNGYWFLSLRDKHKYAFRTIFEPSTDVQMNLRPNKIGIFVDFEKGQVSFYNIDAKIHIYTFSDTFNESIFPFFSPCNNKSGKNDGPLVITPVNTNE